MMFPLFSGSGYKDLVVIFNGCVLAEDIPRSKALWAHILQFAALYVFGASYEFDRDDNTITSIEWNDTVFSCRLLGR